jgi:hypothetical protein
MTDGPGPIEYTARERALFDALPRERPSPPFEETAILAELRAEGLLPGRRPPAAGRRVHWRIAAGVARLMGSVGAGYRMGERAERARSLEGMLDREDLTLTDRVFVMQRAGSAYVRAAHDYATASKGVDSTAIHVASQTLAGVAKAVARTDLDGGLSERLTAVLGNRTQPVSWY